MAKKKSGSKGGKKAGAHKKSGGKKKPTSKKAKLRADLHELMAAEVVAVPSTQVVIQMSNNGPYDVRAITVDQRHVVEPFSTSQARTVIDITPDFHPPAKIGWLIFAGVQFPKAGVFITHPNQPPQLLGAQQPLKKGVPWIDEKVGN